MNNNKRALLPGLSLFVCFCLLTGAEKLIELYNLPPVLMALLEIGCFGLALLMALPGMDRQLLVHRLGFPMPYQGGFVLIGCTGAATAMLGICINLLEYRLLGRTGLNLTLASLPMPVDGMSFLWRVLIGAVLAAVLEEIYLRGALFGIHGSQVGTSACLLFGGLIYALLCGDPPSMAAAFCVGAVFTYLTYVFDTVWAAVLAHIVYALLTIAVQWLADTYAPFGIWNILPALSVLLLLLFAFLTLYTLEKMLVRNSIPHFEVSAGWYDMWLLVREPGFIVFVLAFIGKLVMEYWIG